MSKPVPGKKYFDTKLEKVVTYIGRALNAKDYEFCDDEDNLIVMGVRELERLKQV